MNIPDLPDLDDDVDTLVSKSLDAFQTELNNEKGESGGGGGNGGGGDTGRPSREELKMKLRQRSMFYSGKRLSKSAQTRMLEQAKQRYKERQEREAEKERRENTLKKSADLSALPSAGKRVKPPVLDLKRKRDFDMEEIDLDDIDESPAVESPKKRRTFSAFGKKTKPEDTDSDIREALSLLDD